MNSVNLMGRITKDIDLRYTNDSKAYCSFTLAVQGYKKDDVDFITCKAFGMTSENMAKYLSKGRQIGVTGRIKTGSYTKDDGVKIYTTDVIVNNFYFADSPKGQAQTENQDSEPTDGFYPIGNDELPFFMIS